MWIGYIDLPLSIRPYIGPKSVKFCTQLHFYETYGYISMICIHYRRLLQYNTVQQLLGFYDLHFTLSKLTCKVTYRYHIMSNATTTCGKTIKTTYRYDYPNVVYLLKIWYFLRNLDLDSNSMHVMHMHYHKSLLLELKIHVNYSR